jgi:Na+-transporting methylmalonyl-CoA/oxaloacetate decarboxylase gamma subunit
MSGAVAVACFVVLFLVYLAMFILIVSAVINSLYDIQCAKKFWKTFSPFLNHQS